MSQSSLSTSSSTNTLAWSSAFLPPTSTSVQVINLTLACNQPPSPASGVELLIGNRPGVYFARHRFTNCAVMVVSNLDMAKLWFIAAEACETNPTPVVMTNSGAVWTNNWLYSSPCPAITYITSNTLPTIMLSSNGGVSIEGYGISNRTYMIWSGSSVSTIAATNVAAVIPGTNGPWTYADAQTNLSPCKFYSIGYSTN